MSIALSSAVLATFLLTASPARADDTPATAGSSPAVAADHDVARSATAPPVAGEGGRSGHTFLSALAFSGIYASMVFAHAVDVDSTLLALRRGAVEVNPVMWRLVGNQNAFIAAKAAMAAGTIYATARIARHSRVHALAAAAAVNSGYLLIARNNYQIARR